MNDQNNNDPKIEFVSIIVIDVERDECLMTKKLKGPEHLRGLLTFPGGKFEKTDASAAHAAAREIFEESGVRVRAQDLIALSRMPVPLGSLHIFVALADLSDAAPQAGELEPIMKMSWSEVCRDSAPDRASESKASPAPYAADTARIIGLLDRVSSINTLVRRDSLPARKRSMALA